MDGKMKRTPRIDGNMAYVPLTRGYEAVIDAADMDKVRNHTWSAYVAHKKDGSVKHVYAVASVGGVMTRMHRVLIGAPASLSVDHRDGDGLNNRMANLRLATTQQNNMNMRRPATNTSGYKGVVWHKQRGKWQAQIKICGKNTFLGLFNCATAAAIAYAQASREMHGEFGRAA